MKSCRGSLRSAFYIIALALCSVAAPVAGAAHEWTFRDGELGAWALTNATVVGRKGPGLELKASSDPWMMMDFTQQVELPTLRAGSTIVVRMSATAGTAAQIFWGGNFNENDSVRTPITADGRVHAVEFTIPRELTVERLRLDPTDRTGVIRIESILIPYTPFSLVIPPGPLVKGGLPAEVRSGPLRLSIDTARWSAFDAYVTTTDGTEYLAGTSIPNDILALADGEQTDLAAANCSWSDDNSTLTAQFVDKGGANWTFTLTFSPAEKEGGVAVTFTAVADKERRVTRLPVLGLQAGNGSFGRKKNQGLFAGLEYLVDEPSSNRLDIENTKSRRFVPDPVKITFPLMSIQSNGVHLGLMWPDERLAALFDSPSRLLKGNGHTMVLSKPAVGDGLRENALFAATPMVVKAGAQVTARAIILGGPAADATAVVKQYLALRPAPKPPPLPREDAAQLAMFVDAYTVTPGAKDGLWRHAISSGSFAPRPAGDVSALLRWLATQTKDLEVALRAEEAATAGLARILDGDYLGNSVSHIVPPAAPLVFGRIDGSLPKLRSRALATIKTMATDGTFRYDGALARTHFEKQADGYAADKIVGILGAARLLGDDDILAAGLKGLDAMSRFDGHVPRGAQTWEIPLHTPDIMGAGRAVEAFLLGYELTGRKSYLDRAIYWAWTGVPFVYLQSPVAGKPVGLYATIAVYGGSHWRDPVWIGLPVQWTGLTYSYPLYRLAELDPSGPWRPIAEGITIAGMQMQWPASDKSAVGLFPDYFHLAAQQRDGPKINPGAIIPNYISLTGKPPLYAFAREPNSGVFINAPARIAEITGDKSKVSFTTVDVPWKEPYYVILARVPTANAVTVDGQVVTAAREIDAAAAPAYRFDADAKRLILKLRGNAAIDVAME